MTIDFDALVASAQTVPELAPRTRVVKPNPFAPVVLVSYQEQAPKQIGPLETAAPGGDSKSQLEQAESKMRSAATKFDSTHEGVKTTVRKFVDESGKGWVQVFAQSDENDLPVKADDVVDPTVSSPSSSGRRRRGSD